MTLGPSRQTIAQRLLAEYAQTGRLPAISGGDNDPPANPPATPPATPPADPVKPKPGEKPDGVTPEIQDWINGIVTKEVKAAKSAAVATEQARIEAERTQAEEERKRQADEERGAFDQVKQSLTGERDKFKADFDTLKGDYDAIEALFVNQFEAGLKELPDVVKAFAPEAEASIKAKVDWLAKAREEAEKLGTQTPRGNGPNPPPGGPPVDKDAEARARAATRPRL